MLRILRIVQPATALSLSASLLLGACAAAPQQSSVSAAGQPLTDAPSSGAATALAATAASAPPTASGASSSSVSDANGAVPPGTAASALSGKSVSTGATAAAPALADFAADVAAERHLPHAYVQALLDEARFSATAARLMTPSGKRIQRSWQTYRARFVEPIRIREGVAFWRQHQSSLDAAAARHGVPASIIAAIIGVETLYGKHQGNFRLLDALYTLGFHFPDPKRPERARFFREQLADLVQLDHEGRLDARQALGSYAGAMGLPQFMPGSLMRYAEDGDQDGRIDLFGNYPDAIASVARFLRLHGWQPGLPVFAPASLPGDPQSWVTGGLQATLTWESLRQHGASATSPQGVAQPWQAHPLGVIDLRDEPRKQVEYRIATPNFFALTEYNRSYFYATSVAELAWELSQRMGYSQPY